MKKIRGIDKRVTMEQLAQLAGVTDKGVYKALNLRRISMTYIEPPEFHLMDQTLLEWIYKETHRSRKKNMDARFRRLDIGLPAVKEYVGRSRRSTKRAESIPSSKPKEKSSAKSNSSKFVKEVYDGLRNLTEAMEEIHALLSLMGMMEGKISEAISFKRECKPIKDVRNAETYDAKSCEDMLEDLHNVPETERTVYTNAWLKTISGWRDKGNDFTIKHKQIILATWISQFEN